MKQELETSVKSNSISWVQGEIENVMRRFQEEERWERITLLSSEGLPMAGYGSSSVYNDDNLLEFAFALIGAVKLIKEDLPVKDIIIRGRERRILIFRYFKAWGEDLILTAVVTGRKGYRRALSQLVKLIRNLE